MRKSKKFEPTLYIVKAHVGRTYNWDRHGKRDIIYFHQMGETILQDLENRRDRPFNLYKKYIPQILRKLGLTDLLTSYELGHTTIKWNQRAGCSCPCSPGFVIKGAYESRGRRIYADFSWKPMQEKVRKITPPAKYKTIKEELIIKKLVPGSDQMFLPGISLVNDKFYDLSKGTTYNLPA